MIIPALDSKITEIYVPVIKELNIINQIIEEEKTNIADAQRGNISRLIGIIGLIISRDIPLNYVRVESNNIDSVDYDRFFEGLQLALEYVYYNYILDETILRKIRDAYDCCEEMFELQYAKENGIEYD